MKRLIALALTAATLASPVAAQTPLSSEKYINDRLIAARAADRIRRECDSINARMIFAFQEARALKRYASDQGYSDAEIDAFLDDRAEKDRIYTIAETYLGQKGATAGNGESFCRIGRDEIAANSVIGTLLVAR